MLEQGSPTLILEEERFNREKHTRKFPFLSLQAAFDDQGLDEIDVITTPWHMGSLWRSWFGRATAFQRALIYFLPVRDQLSPR